MVIYVMMWMGVRSTKGRSNCSFLSQDSRWNTPFKLLGCIKQRYYYYTENSLHRASLQHVFW